MRLEVVRMSFGLVVGDEGSNLTWIHGRHEGYQGVKEIKCHFQSTIRVNQFLLIAFLRSDGFKYEMPAMESVYRRQELTV